MGALTVDEDDEVMVVMEKGKIVRSRVDEIRRTGRNTQGVKFAAPDKGDAIVAVARNNERAVAAELGVDPEAPVDGAGPAPEGEAGGIPADGEPGDSVDSSGSGADAVASGFTDDPHEAAEPGDGSADDPDGGTQ